MKAVIARVSEHFLEERRRRGADRWDEMWEGVLHLPPAPNREHQDFEWTLEAWLRAHWAPIDGGKVYHQINVAPTGGWPSDYRIPDVVLLTPERFGIDKNQYFEGAPDVVIEIRSPDDESYEKLSFYHRLGVPEVWIIDRDTREPEVFRHAGTGEVYEVEPRTHEGWVQSGATGVELRATPGGKLEIGLRDRPEVRQAIP